VFEKVRLHVHIFYVQMQAVDPPSLRKDRRGRVVKPLIDDTQVYCLFLYSSFFAATAFTLSVC